MGTDIILDPNSASGLPEHIRRELEFQLSLLRLATVPHRGYPTTSPATEEELKDLANLVPVRRT